MSEANVLFRSLSFCDVVLAGCGGGCTFATSCWLLACSGESDGKEKPTVEPMKPIVLGTAVATDGRSFATLQLGDASPTLVHVGDKIGEWVVKAIERGKIVLVSTSGTRADLTVPKPGT